MVTIILDAGHGDNNIGDAYGSRYEKDDNLKLTLALGEVLEQYGYNVYYTRESDVYLSQNDRVNIANMANGDFFLSIHRVIGELIVSESGLGFSVDTLGGIAEETAINIAKELQPLGFYNYSIIVRTELPVISETNMPALMIAIGNLNSDYENMLFDTRLMDIATAIANGIYETIPPNENVDTNTINISMELDKENGQPLTLYSVQVGAFTDYNNALNQHNELLEKGYQSSIVERDPYYLVHVGCLDDLDSAAALEFRLKLEGYNTLVVRCEMNIS